MAVVELALILVYLCVLLIKQCDMSSVSTAISNEVFRDDDEAAKAICRTFGLGETPNGVYVFFILFALGMILVQILIGTTYLWVTPGCDSIQGAFECAAD